MAAAFALTASLVAEDTVRGVMQAMPGDELALIDAEVRPTPTNLSFLHAGEVKLKPLELVLGVETEEGSWAIPIRYLAIHEVVNSRLGGLPVTATW